MKPFFRLHGLTAVFLLVTLTPVVNAEELTVVEKSTTLCWEASEGCVKYGVEFQKQGSAVWSRFIVGDVKELKVTMPAGTYHFRIVGLTPEGIATDPGNTLTVTFLP